MTQWRYYSNVAVPDTLAATISNSATSLYAGSGAPAGYPTSFPFTLALELGTGNFELVSVTAGAGTSASPWTVSRGYDGTLARSHSAGAGLLHSWSAGDLTTAAVHEAAGSGSGVHGLPASAWLGSALATISETSLAGSTTNAVSWSSIPQTYAHLLVVVQARLTETTALTDDITLQFNGDTGGRYSFVETSTSSISGVLTAPASADAYAIAGIPAFRAAASQGGSPVNAGGGFAVIPNYSGAVFNKQVYSHSGAGNGTSAMVDQRMRTGIWNPSAQAAVTALTLTAPTGSFFLAGSSFGLYGLG